MCRVVGVVQLLVAALVAPALGYGQASPRLPEPDRVRLAEAFRLAESVRSSVWPGWERTPMAVLLVADSVEYLVGHPRPTPDFSSLGRDSLLGREVLVRARRFPPTLLATFPAVGGMSTIVVGSPKRTGKTAAQWVLTLLHEHFHQWQTSLPDYYVLADGLGLARGDTTGQWMLDYPFPYDSAPVGRAVRTLAGSLARAITAPTTETFTAVARDREVLRRLLSADDDRYLEFQLWQEGVSRFVELAAAEAAAKAGKPAPAFRRLPDYLPYAELAARLRRELERELAGINLAGERRVSFYPLGAGLALLLERSDPEWRRRYETHPFSLPGPARWRLSP
jgi:hypothetical protein